MNDVCLVSDSSEGICCQLIAPPPKREPERVELPADVQKKWQEIPRKQITILGDLGKGQFGVVRKGKSVIFGAKSLGLYIIIAGIWKPTEAIALDVAVKGKSELPHRHTLTIQGFRFRAEIG